MPLRITDLNSIGQIGVLNKWATYIESQLKATNTKIFAVSNTAVATIPPPVVGATDGLVHGDAVWEYDSAYSILRDDFVMGTASTSPLGDNSYWKLSGTGSPTASNYGGAFPYLGQVQIYPGSTAADSTAFIAPGNVLGTAVTRSVWDFAWPLLDYPGWKMTWVFTLRPPDPDNGGTLQTFSASKLSVYVGLANAGGAVGGSFAPGARPNVFFGCRFDTDTSAPSIGDTTYHLEACINAINTTTSTTRYNNQGTLGGTFDTAIAPVSGEMHRLEISYITAGSLVMTFDGVSTTFPISKLVNSLPNNVISTGGGNSRMPTAVSGGFTNTNGYTGVGAGSLVTFAGATFPTPYVGTFPVLQSEGGTFTVIKTPPSGVGGLTGAFTMTAYPALYPIASIGVDSTGSGPGVLTRGLAVDYFSFVWNKGLAGGGTPVATNPRYW